MRTDLSRQPKGASAAAIRNQIDKILTSESFAGSRKLSQLLAFLVDQAIEGHDLNEYSIAVDVFQKDDSFDPRIDPLVRVHTSRLRSKLNQYRATAGLHDPIEIELPPRTYVPRIRVRARPMRPKAPEPVNVARNIVVRSFRCLSSEEPDEYFCEGLVEEIIHAMTKIRHLRVFPIETVRGSRNAGLNFRELSEKLGVEAVLDGNVRKRLHKLRVAAHLTNAADGSVTWSEMYEHDIAEDFATQVFAIQEQIAHSIVNALWLGSDLAAPGQPALAPADDLQRITCTSQDVSISETRAEWA